METSFNVPHTSWNKRQIRGLSRDQQNCLFILKISFKSKYLHSKYFVIVIVINSFIFFNINFAAVLFALKYIPPKL